VPPDESWRATATVAATGVEPAPTRWLIEGSFYTPLVHTCQWEGEQAIAAVSALEIEPDTQLQVPDALLASIAEYFAKLGDTQPISYLDL
jgi:hypothetical protein